MKKYLPSIIIVLIGVAISVTGIKKGDTALGIIVLAGFLAVAGVLIFKKKKTGIEPAKSFENFNYLKDNIDGYHLSYKYDHKLCVIKGEAAPGKNLKGAELTFKQEPENEFDKLAVAIYSGSERIGYMYRDDHQEMANDYLRRGWIVKGYLISTGENARYVVGFYKPIK